MNDSHTNQASARLDVRNASKTFAGLTVLRSANLRVMPGEMHGIVGQNGSGKSTLAKVIAGYHAPDSGCEVAVDGTDLPVPVRLRDLRAAGVGIVHQDLGLIETGTVVENVRIAALQGSGPLRRIHWRREAAAAKAALDRLGYAGSLRSRVSELLPADRARVAIARAIQDHQPGQGILVFDEATRALPLDALEDFYATVRSLQEDGTAVVNIGHRLEEILQHCDRVTVLRDGRVVAEGVETEGVSEGNLAGRMLGHELKHLELDVRSAGAQEKKIQIGGLTGGTLVEPLDLEVGAGEIVGLTGLPGSGFEAVPYLLAGAEPATGELHLDERTFRLAECNVSRLIRAGVVLVPEKRQLEGLALNHTVVENTSLPWLKERSKPWTLVRRRQIRDAETMMGRLGVVPPDPHQLVGNFSGGNQQKVLLAKWLAGSTRLLLLHEPTQAVDVQARQELLRAIHDVAAEGTSVILASSEAEDLVTLCDRILVFRGGAQAEKMTAFQSSEELIDATYSTMAKSAVAATPSKDSQGDTP
jgi:ribose transport system ATP-binding protein